MEKSVSKDLTYLFYYMTYLVIKITEIWNVKKMRSITGDWIVTIKLRVTEYLINKSVNK